MNNIHKPVWIKSARWLPLTAGFMGLGGCSVSEPVHVYHLPDYYQMHALPKQYQLGTHYDLNRLRCSRKEVLCPGESAAEPSTNESSELFE
jgi:hypothetical protein